MRRVRAILIRLLGFFGRERWEADLDDELNGNLQLHIEENIRAGMSPQAARRAAQLHFGGIAQAKEQYRDRKIIPALGGLLRDIRYSARALATTPGFSLAVVIMLALCIGANATVLSALYGLVLKPLPVKDPERLVQLFNLRENRSPDNPYSESGWNQYADLRSRSSLFEGVALRSRTAKLIGRDGVVQRLRGQQATAEFFDIMGVEPVLGRFFLPEEVAPGPGYVVVLSQTFWEMDFGSDPDVVGKQIVFDNGVPHTIIGVAPRSMEAFDYEAKFTIPYFANAQARNPARGRYNAHGDDLWLRLRAGVSREAALERVREIERDWFENVADADGRRLYQFYNGRVEFDLPHPLERSLYLLEGSSLFIFLTGCFNVMILFLSRVNQKRHEFSLRQALGAEMFVLRRLMLVESGLLAGAAALAGAAMAWGGTTVINRYLATLSPHTMPIELDPLVLGATLAASLGIVGAMNLIPLEVLWRSGALGKIDSSQRTASMGKFSSKLSSGMVVGQVAIAFVMLIGAGLLLSSFRNVLAVDPGFEPGRVVEGRLDFTTVRTFYPSRSDAAGVKRRIYEAMAEIPGVESVALSMFPMLSHDLRAGGTNFMSSGAATAVAYSPSGNYVSPGFFATMGIPILSGRACSSSDTAQSVVVDELYARRILGDLNAVGLEVPRDDNRPREQVIGVSGRANLRGLEQRDQQPFIYSCEAVDHGWWEYSILLRTSRQAEGVIQDMHEKLREVDSRLALSRAHSLEQSLDDMLVSRRAITVLLACFAGLAFLLSAIGIYAVLANSVVERRREIGIRFALGARGQEIYRLILANGLGKTVIGLGLGGVGVIAVNRFLTRFLFDVTSLDPLTYVAAVALILIATLMACLLPARRALGIHPVESLRAE